MARSWRKKCDRLGSPPPDSTVSLVWKIPGGRNKSLTVGGDGWRAEEQIIRFKSESLFILRERGRECRQGGAERKGENPKQALHLEGSIS